MRIAPGVGLVPVGVRVTVADVVLVGLGVTPVALGVKVGDGVAVSVGGIGVLVIVGVGVNLVRYFSASFIQSTGISSDGKLRSAVKS